MDSAAGHLQATKSHLNQPLNQHRSGHQALSTDLKKEMLSTQYFLKTVTYLRVQTRSFTLVIPGGKPWSFIILHCCYPGRSQEVTGLP